MVLPSPQMAVDEHLAYRLLMSAGSEELPELHELLERPPWMADAACAEHPELPWVPNSERTGATSAQLEVCAGCLVRAECLSWAIDNDEVGVWAGTNQRERRRLRRGVA